MHCFIVVVEYPLTEILSSHELIRKGAPLPFRMSKSFEMLQTEELIFKREDTLNFP